MYMYIVDFNVEHLIYILIAEQWICTLKVDKI